MRNGCEVSGTCCTTHASKACYDNDVYWFNSCGQAEDKYEECQQQKTYTRTGYTFTSASGICSASTAACVPKLDITMNFVSKTANIDCDGVGGIDNWCCQYTPTFKNNGATDIIIDKKKVYSYCESKIIQDLSGAGFLVSAGASRTSGINKAWSWGIYPTCNFDDIRLDTSGNELGRINFNCPNSWP